jgi:hypothetical protein
MRFYEIKTIKPLKPLSPSKARIAGLKRQVELSKQALRLEKVRQQHQQTIRSVGSKS